MNRYHRHFLHLCFRRVLYRLSGADNHWLCRRLISAVQEECEKQFDWSDGVMKLQTPETLLQWMDPFDASKEVNPRLKYLDPSMHARFDIFSKMLPSTTHVFEGTYALAPENPFGMRNQSHFISSSRVQAKWITETELTWSLNSPTHISPLTRGFDMCSHFRIHDPTNILASAALSDYLIHIPFTRDGEWLTLPEFEPPNSPLVLVPMMYSVIRVTCITNGPEDWRMVTPPDLEYIGHGVSKEVYDALKRPFRYSLPGLHLESNGTATYMVPHGIEFF